MMPSEKLAYRAEYIKETGKAFLLEVEGEQIWFPKTQVEYDGKWLYCPEWLAKDKGLSG